MSLRNYFGVLLVALSFPSTYTNAELRAGGVNAYSSSSPVVPEHKPYVVAIYDGKKYICTGSLITLEYVVTAAKCVRTNLQQRMKVKAGVDSVYDDGHVRKACALIGIWNDLGIIEVHPAFNRLDSTVGTIELCKSSLEPGNEMHVNGWYSFSDKICSTVETIVKKECCTPYIHVVRKSFTGTTCDVYGLQGFVDSGAPGVVGGSLCAVARSFLSKSQTMLYTDLSVGSPARRYIEGKTGCS